MESISSVMNRGINMVDGSTSIRDAALKMKEKDIGFLCIGDQEKPQGCITDRDIVVKSVAEGNASQTVQDIADSRVVCAQESDSIDNGIQMMKDNKVQRLVVTDENGRAVGTVALGRPSRQLFGLFPCYGSTS